jgi:uncharacterized membrane protein
VPNFHPILVHFTIALFFTSVVLDVIGYLAKKESLKIVGWWNLLLAGIFAVPTVITGLVAEASLPHTDEAHRLMEIHKILGLIVLGALILLVIWRGFNRGALPARLSGLFLLVGIVGLSVMVAGAYYGGEMVYVHGMGVAPMMEQMASGHDHSEHEHIGEEAEAARGHHEGMVAKEAYTCLMHPEVTSDEPGNCPKCGMTLQGYSLANEHGEEAMQGMRDDAHEEKEQSHDNDNRHDHSGHEH